MKRYFRPQKDITAYDAAYLLSHMATNPVQSMWLSGVEFQDDQWSELPAEMRRHFSDQP